MRIGVSHLKGPQRGRVETLSGTRLRVGSDRKCELRLKGSGVERIHATLELEGTDVHLRPVGPVRVNGREVGEIAVQNYDLIEFGGTKLRLRLLPDGVALPDRPGPRAARLPAWAALIALLATAGVMISHRRDDEDLSRRIENEAAWAAARRRSSQKSIGALRDELHDLRVHAARRNDVDAKVREVQRAVAEVESSMLSRVTTEIERSLAANPDLAAARHAAEAAGHVISSHSGAVCIIQGTYGFGRTIGGEWQFLREVDPKLLNELDLDGEKVPLMLDGAGALFRVEFTGTGFLVDDGGIVMTNRHIARPWWNNDGARPLIKDGFAPRFIVLRLYFPGLKRGIDCNLPATLISEEVDLAVLRFAPPAGLPKPLELAPARDAVSVGREVILLGYPSGLNALVARSDETINSDDPLHALDRLADRNLIRPLPTRGYISDRMPKKIVFDAPTAVGGSGGPLLDLQGRVVAVNYGILKAFGGANFGVPVRFARDLLTRARAAAASKGR